MKAEQSGNQVAGPDEEFAHEVQQGYGDQLSLAAEAAAADVTARTVEQPQE